MIIIAGHGPSMEGSGLGEVIDSYDCPIVRFNGFTDTCSAVDRGNRVDYLCTTTLQFPRFLAHRVFPTREVWVYNTNNVLSHVNKYNRGPLYLTNLTGWLEIYRGLRARKTANKFCKGLAAIIIAAMRLGVSKMVLFGFDNLWLGKSDNFRTLGTSKFKGVYTTKHDYAAQRKMIDMVADCYNVDISHWSANEAEKTN